MSRFEQLKRLWRTDLYRYEARTDARALAHALVTVPGYRYTFAMRACKVLTAGRGGAVHATAVMVMARYSRRYGIGIPFDTEIGEGFYIGHFGGIVVNHRARIGRNCTISHGVTLGQTNRGSRAGAPTIGDGVYIGPGAAVIGGIAIGNNVAIGANSVVTDDVPDNAVVAGSPARVISDRGAEAYVNFTDY
jgi:serine O-acetyltransferase